MKKRCKGPEEKKDLHRLNYGEQEVNSLQRDQNREVRFEQLYQQYGNDVLRMAYFYLGDRQKAEDACQEVFIRLYTHDNDIEKGKEKAWLMRVTVNYCRDVWRSAWLKRVVLGPPIMEMIPAPENDDLERQEEKEALMRAVNKLPASFREVVLLFYYQEMGIAEISAVLNIPEGTVSSRLSRAKEKLGKLLEKE